MCAHIIAAVPNITLSLPADLHRKMKRHPEVKWSEVVRRAIAQRIQDLERMDALARKSHLASADVDEIGHLVKEGLRRRYERARKGSGA